ncbi:MAG: hypothetical protein IPJ00_01705 [Saprospirales bacterium]|nr:hypothetical protein [Saprospirales bacterium]
MRDPEVRPHCARDALFRQKSKGRRFINDFSTSPLKMLDIKRKLDFPAWREKAGLDTLEYYRFLYPGKSIYRFEYPATDSIAQLAPFVLKNGAPQPVQVVYVDQRPVYFGWSHHFRPYSFSMTPGYHRVDIRTTDRAGAPGQCVFAPGEKLIFSVSDSVSAPGVRISPMPEELTAAERENLYRYIFPYRQTHYGQYPYLEQKQEFIALWPAQTNSHRSGTELLAGPLMPN